MMDPLAALVGVTKSVVMVVVCALATTHDIHIMRAVKVKSVLEKERELDLRYPKQLL
jgi:hypothetical protein